MYLIYNNYFFNIYYKAGIHKVFMSSVRMVKRDRMDPGGTSLNQPVP